jgi:hypothetical protein
MAAPVNQPVKYAGADGNFIEVALSTLQAKETTVGRHFFYKGAQHDASASGITSTNFVITDVSGNLIGSHLHSFTAYNNFLLSFRMPTSVTTAQYVYVQWGTGITRANSATAFSDFEAFYDTGVASGNLPDLTGNGHDGVATTPAAYSVAGKVGNGITVGVAGVSNGYFTTDWLGTGLSAATFHGWIMRDAAGTFPRLFEYGTAAQQTPSVGSGVADATKIAVVDRTNNTGSQSVAGITSDATWHHIAATADGSNLQIILDGTAGPDTAEGHVVAGTTTPLRIGARNTADSLFWYGKINFLRISGVKRSANWLLCEYNNENGFATDAIFTVSDTTAFASSGVQLGPFSSYAFAPTFENGIWR